MTSPDSAPSFALRRQSIDLRFRMAALAERTWETDTYVRARLRGDDLVGFTSPGSDDHIRLFFPDRPVGSVEQMREAPSREYTPLAWADDWLDVEFAIHGEPGNRGLAAEWAASADIGAVIGVGGPRGSLLLEGTPETWFLAGDETAVPALRRFIASMALDATGLVLLEVRDPAHELALNAPLGVRVEYVHRNDGLNGTALAARLDAISAEQRPTGDVFAFVAAEQAIVKPARALAVDRWGLDTDRIVVKGYWKQGDEAFHAPH